jgi:hypothetical protein
MAGNSAVVLLNSEEGRALAKRHCREAGLSVSALFELIEAELDQQGKKRKAGLWEEFDRIFDGLEEEQ